MCSSACPTQDHKTFGECIRAKGLKIAYCGQGGGDATVQRKWDANLQAYRDARKQGINPDSSKVSDVRKAVEISNRTGVAYQGRGYK